MLVLRREDAPVSASGMVGSGPGASPVKVSEGLVICWPDTHVPDQHTRAVANLTKFIGDQQPALVLMTGDFLDCLSVARWSADTLMEAGSFFQREVDEGRRILSDLRAVYDGPISFLPGNHEDRLAKWGATRGKGVFGLRALTIPGLLDFDGFGIETPGAPFEFAKGVIGIHGERLGNKAGLSVSKEMDRFGTSIAMGHCHRLALVFRNVGGHQTFGIEGGHLMDQRKAGYLSYGLADWQMGFSTIEVHRNRVVPQIIPIRKSGSFDYQGDTWE